MQPTSAALDANTVDVHQRLKSNYKFLRKQTCAAPKRFRCSKKQFNLSLYPALLENSKYVLKTPIIA
jgi:hypothetical protein